MTIVSNSSPLINLARIGQLDLLRKLYGTLTIPEAVWSEVVIEGTGQPGAGDIQTADWIKRRSVANQSLVHALQHELDKGEAEAIALSVEIEANLLLMDERIGREISRHLGLRFTGLIGVLIEAKHKKLIPEIKAQMDALRDIAGFYTSDALYERVLADEGEV